MAEPITTSTVATTALVAGVAAVWAVIDPSITSIALAIIAALVVIIPLWFKFRTDAMNLRMKEQDVKIEGVIKTSDGMKDALVKATADAALAKGVLVGIDKAETRAAVIAVAKAEGKAEAATPAVVPIHSTVLTSEERKL